MLNFGLAGNPNSGKTTLFNFLTGSTAHVGNWPGVTVDRKEGVYNCDNNPINIIDLPGIYSLSPYTPEEIIARNYLIEDTPDLIINIVDATNIERNLYLTTQLLELNCPVVIALNRIDLVEKEGGNIDAYGLSKILQVPVFPISAARGSGITELIKAAVIYSSEKRNGYSVLHNSKLGSAIDDTCKLLKQTKISHPVFNAVKILENDRLAIKNIELVPFQKELEKIKASIISNNKYADIEAIVADERYKYITEYCVAWARKNRDPNELTPSEKADKILTHKYFGIPIFLLFMFIVFHLTFSESFLMVGGLSSPGVFLKNIAGDFINFLANRASLVLNYTQAPDWLHGLLVKGIIGGVGSVLSFVPQILCLFLFLSILEDSGYMARAAFIMDNILRKFGLSGRAFLPLLMGFGCSVPAMMAARTLESEKDRRITIMIVPFMSCGAKMPIYALFVSALFTHSSDLVIFGIYLIGIVTAAVTAIILKKTILKADDAPFIMELPIYRLPSPKSLILLLWEKLKDYLIRAGTLILASTIIIWLLSNFSFSLQMVEENSNSSMLGAIGSLLVPFFTPLGFADGDGAWKSIVAILAGLVAKEAVVSTLGVLYTQSSGGGFININDTSFLSVIASSFTPLSAVSFMVFNLLCIPCAAAVSTMYAEMKSKKWALMTILMWILTAWIISFLIYNIGSFLGL